MLATKLYKRRIFSPLEKSFWSARRKKKICLNEREKGGKGHKKKKHISRGGRNFTFLDSKFLTTIRERFRWVGGKSRTEVIRFKLVLGRLSVLSGDGSLGERKSGKTKGFKRGRKGA